MFSHEAESVMARKRFLLSFHLSRFMNQILVLLLLTLFCFFTDTLSGREIRVGIYQNPPKVFLDESKNPQGIFIDIMNDIARREHWEVEYIFNTWDSNLVLLKQGKLDIVLDVSYLEERENFFTFNHVPVIESWLQVFTTRTTSLNAIHDLNNKKIAVLKGSIQENYLKEQLQPWFHLDFTVYSYPDYPSSIKALKAGEVDLIVATRFFYFTLSPHDDIIPTPIVFRPSHVYFAFPKTPDNPLIPVIDRHISRMKNSTRSVYYTSLHTWLNSPESFRIPQYIVLLLIVLGVGLFFFIGFTILLKRQVRQKTSTLEAKNLALEKAYKQEKIHEAEIEKSLAEKELLLKEVHHRVKNNLNVISSLLRIQAKRIHHPEEAQNAFQNSSERVMTISLVHNLLYTSGDLQEINSTSFVEALTTYLLKTYSADHIKIIQHVESLPLNIDQAIPCGLILSELLTNALKHAFSIRKDNKNSEINISCYRVNTHHVRLCISDNGIGIKDVDTFRQKGTLGYHLIQLLTEQLQGTFSMSGDKGVHVTIEFPLKKS